MRKHVCCTAVCVVCTAVLFYLHFFVYGGLLFNNLLLVGATCAAAAAAATGRIGGSREPWFPPNHIVTRLCQLIWCAALGTIPYVLCIDPYSLDNWIVFLLWIAVTVIELVHREDNSAAYSIAMVLALCVTGAFLLIVHPITVSQARNLVEQAGYTDLYRFQSVDWDATRFAQVINNDTEIIGCTMPEEKDPLGWYGFRAFKDGERYCVVVSAARGQIEVQEKQGE